MRQASAACGSRRRRHGRMAAHHCAAIEIKPTARSGRHPPRHRLGPGGTLPLKHPDGAAAAAAGHLASWAMHLSRDAHMVHAGNGISVNLGWGSKTKPHQLKVCTCNNTVAPSTSPAGHHGRKRSRLANAVVLTMRRVATRLTRSLKPSQRPKSGQSMIGTWSWTHVIAACLPFAYTTPASCLFVWPM